MKQVIDNKMFVTKRNGEVVDFDPEKINNTAESLINDWTPDKGDYDQTIMRLEFVGIKDGKEIWSFKSEKSFIKSQQKLSFIINDNNLVFINTLGDLSSIDIETGNLVWQTPTQSSAIYENYFSLKNSDFLFNVNVIYTILSGKLIYLSSLKIPFNYLRKNLDKCG